MFTKPALSSWKICPRKFSFFKTCAKLNIVLFVESEAFSRKKRSRQQG